MNWPLLLEKGLKWIEYNGWNDFNPAFLVDDDHCLGDILQYVETRASFLKQFIDFIDDCTIKIFLQELPYLSEDITQKEIIWEILMSRFEVMNSYKPAIKRIWQDSLYSVDITSLAAHFFSDSDHKMKKMAEKISPSVQTVFIKPWFNSSLVWYGLRQYVFLTWVDEENPQMPQTMAILDQAIETLLA